jgi:hypothetical protein
MRKWFKPKLLVMLLPVLIALPFWWASSTAYASTDSRASGTLPWDNANGNGASTSFQMAAISSVLSGTLICPNMIQSVAQHGTPTLQIWLIEDSHGGRLDASGETHCTQAQTSWTLSAGQNPAGQYHLWVNCHWGGCGHDVKVSYGVDTGIAAPVVTRAAAPAGNTLTADLLLNQTLKNQTPKPAQAYAIHTGWATSASPVTGFFPSSSIQHKIAADAIIACNNPAGTLRMSLKISPNSSLNPNKVLNSTTLSCQSGSGHTDDLSVSTNMGFTVTFDNATNTGNWSVKYVASADKPLPTPTSTPSCTNNCNPGSCTSNCNHSTTPCVSNCNPDGTDHTTNCPPGTSSYGSAGCGVAGCPSEVTSNGGGGCFPNGNCANGYVNGNGVYICLDASSNTTPVNSATALYCKDGINGAGQGIIQQSGIPINANTDCSNASSPGSINDCIAGYVLDDWQKDDLNETFTGQVSKLKQEATTIGPCSSYNG